MQDFFPDFFHKISDDELFYLKNNESWVLDIFEDFWKLLLNKLDVSLLNHVPLNAVPIPHDPSPPPLDPPKPPN
jgi:hypothetical protein